MTYTAHKLSNLAREYYPSGISVQSPHYASTEQVRRRRAICLQAEKQREPFKAVLRLLEAQFPDHWVGDETSLLLEPSLSVRVSVERHDPTDEDAVLVVGCVSVFAPMYMTYAAWGASMPGASGVSFERDETNATVWDAVHRTFEERLGVTYVGPDVGLTVVPDVDSGSAHFGHVSLYDLLFNSHRW